jgi:hypothetical protein
LKYLRAAELRAAELRAAEKKCGGKRKRRRRRDMVEHSVEGIIMKWCYFRDR